MSKSDEEKRIQQIILNLEVNRKRVEKLRALVPNLESLSSIDEISSEEGKKLFHLTALALIVSFEGEFEVSAHVPPMFTAKKDKEIFEWRDEKLVPIYKKMRGLILGANEVPDHGNRIQTAFVTLLKFMKYMKDHHDFQLDERGGYVFMWERIIDWQYFQPDAWDRNERALAPIVIKRDIGKIPEHIRERVTEIYRSFIFGNWMAAIALSRCLLEYAIVEQGDVLDIDVYETRKKKWVRRFVDFIKRVALGEVPTDEKKRVRRLVDLIKDVKKTHPELVALVASMHQIREAGNRVMHPPKKNEERKLPGEDDAEKCYMNIRKIISELYGK